MSIIANQSYLNYAEQSTSLLTIIKVQHSKCEMSSKEILNQIIPNSDSRSTYSQSSKSITDNVSQAQIPSDYLNDIWWYLLSIEHEQDYSYSWTQKQYDISDKMRYILIDWIIDIHFRLSFRQSTLHLTVNIIDRFISKKQILRTRFQLLGIGALFIACKYEEISYPRSSTFIELTDKTYSKDELLTMEHEILSTLSFSLTLPSSLNFFEIISIIFNFSNREILFGNYLLEAFLCDAKIAKYLPSVNALAVSYIIMKITNNNKYKQLNDLINNNNTTISYKEIKVCAHDIYSHLENDKTNCNSIYNKYSSESYERIAITGILMNNS